MSMVNIRQIELVSNPAKFDDEYHFRIKFEAIAPLQEDLEWRLIYVGSAKSEEYDQELDSCLVGPIPAGINAFDFLAPAPAHHLLPSVEPEEILGVTVIIITASYRDKEFVRVGYYVNTYYEDEAMMETPPATVEWDKLYRNVLIARPKVTRFQNPWDTGAASPFDAPLQQEAGQSSSGGGSNYMLDSAPLPPPVTKAAPALPSAEESDMSGGNGSDHNNGFGSGISNGHASGHGGGMDVEMVA
ncbi:ASF1 like histone chaperone-domain-containing protein [Kockovaella imperatae]|uniref:Anti-silencing function protein 1 n=1 Tax=Kockovaella imperatae TaxID=4999 RepID=A0A1Y1UHB8_9TREE|nr:ASF1 like histone chaperone-domain-containing protein [Kockovaella imperatae]ORX36886.1 ASF1 like histone chaperone-domain-containing protein [Kockovaella imperatae]